jgi:hypothetical protein
MCHNPPGLLPAVLQRVQPEGDKVCGVSDANNPEYSAFFMQFIVIKRVGGRHSWCGQSWQLQIRFLKAYFDIPNQRRPVTRLLTDFAYLLAKTSTSGIVFGLVHRFN